MRDNFYHRYIVISVLIMTSLFVIGLVQGCATAASTPVLGPIEPYVPTKLERAIVPAMPGDEELIEVTLGEQRQALADSEQLDDTLALTDTLQEDLKSTVEQNNSNYDAYRKTKSTLELVTASGIILTVLSFCLGRSLTH